jgi:hypothetical protein
MSTITSATITANRTAERVEYRLYFDGFHQTADGLYRGTFPARGEGVFGRPAFLRGFCGISGNSYTIPELTIEPTTNVLKGSTRATLALFDKDTDHLLNIVFQNAQIPATPDPITIAEILAYQTPTAPVTPSAPTASYVTDHISVTFTLTSGATGGKLYRSVNGGAFNFLSNVTTSPYSDSDLLDETDYAYKVSATNTAGESAESVASNTVTTPLAPLTLSEIPGAQLWLKSESLTGTDGDAIASWADSSGNANNAAQGTTANKPTLKTSVVNSKNVARFDGVNDYLSYTGISARTIAFVYKHGRNVANYGPVVSDTSSVVLQADIGIDLTHNPTSFDSGVADAKIASANLFMNGRQIDRINLPKAVAGWSVYIFELSATDTVTTIANNLGAYFMNGDVAEVIVSNTTWTSDQKTNVMDKLMSKYAINKDRSEIVVVGDSISCSGAKGRGGDSNQTVWPIAMLPQFAAMGFGEFDLFNTALSGQSLELMDSRSNSAVAGGGGVRLYHGTRDRKIAIIFGGANDLLDITSGTDLFNRVKAVADTFKAAGYITCVCTVIRRNEYSDSAINDKRLAGNQLMRDSMSGTPIADILADLCSSSIMDDWSFGYIGPFFDDTTHPNGAGELIIADIITQAIADYYSLTVPARSNAITLDFDADDVTGSEGDAISLWPGVGSLPDAVPTAASGTHGPLLHVAALNGHNAIEFNQVTALTYQRRLCIPDVVKIQTVAAIVKLNNPAADSGAFPGVLGNMTMTADNNGDKLTFNNGTTLACYGVREAIFNDHTFLSFFRNGVGIARESGSPHGYDCDPVDEWMILIALLPTQKEEDSTLGSESDSDAGVLNGHIARLRCYEGICSVDELNDLLTDWGTWSGITTTPI